MDRNFYPFAILNKQAHIDQWQYTSCVTVRYVFLSHNRAYFSSSLIQKSFLTDNQYFSLLMFWQIRYVDGNTALHNILVFK